MSIVETTPVTGRWETMMRSLIRERSGEPAAVRAMREAAFARFAELGVPAPTDEEWRLTPVQAIASSSWELPTSRPVSDEALASWRLGEAAASEIVFIDGRFDRSRSRIAGEGASFRSLASVLESP
ncbi:MAG TPA: hypothetical protein VFV54_11050, partial [Thermoanaerobaculia bacterium]|nr:hypothetical protein [Thermoanaerobaculia bacterium]